MSRFCWLLLTFLTFSACAEKAGLAAVRIMPGVTNDPRNKSLRFDILRFGLDEFCFEMTRSSVELKMADDQPVIGRFHADACHTELVDDETRQSLVLQYGGVGWAWSNVTQRVGFRVEGLVEYAPDFQLDGKRMYVYFRPVRVSSTQFRTQLVESQTAVAGAGLAGLDPDALGRGIVEGQLRRGFTVIRQSDDGDMDFSVGYVAKGATPFRPFSVVSSGRQTLANTRTEVHSHQQDVIGSFEITSDKQALYLTMALEGEPAVDVLLVPQVVGTRQVELLTTQPGVAPLAGMPVFGALLQRGQPFQQAVPLPPGRYHLVIDHSLAAGTAAPTTAAGDDRAARVDYLVQRGKAP